jgi:hypothetical protein
MIQPCSVERRTATPTGGGATDRACGRFSPVSLETDFGLTEQLRSVARFFARKGFDATSQPPPRTRIAGAVSRWFWL